MVINRLFPFERDMKPLTRMIHSMKSPAADIADGLHVLSICRAIWSRHLPCELCERSIVPSLRPCYLDGDDLYREEAQGVIRSFRLPDLKLAIPVNIRESDTFTTALCQWLFRNFPAYRDLCEKMIPAGMFTEMAAYRRRISSNQIQAMKRKLISKEVIATLGPQQVSLCKDPWGSHTDTAAFDRIFKGNVTFIRSQRLDAQESAKSQASFVRLHSNDDSATSAPFIGRVDHILQIYLPDTNGHFSEQGRRILVGAKWSKAFYDDAILHLKTSPNDTFDYEELNTIDNVVMVAPDLLKGGRGTTTRYLVCERRK